MILRGEAPISGYRLNFGDSRRFKYSIRGNYFGSTESESYVLYIPSRPKQTKKTLFGMELVRKTNVGENPKRSLAKCFNSAMMSLLGEAQLSR